MTFHVQLEQSRHSARLFNLTEDELRRRLFEPWSRGEPAHLAEREWDPVESRLIVLEGRSLDASELALGRGWNAAIKIGHDVTRELLARELPAPASEAPAIVAAPEVRALAISLLEELGMADASDVTILVGETRIVVNLKDER